MSKLLIESLTEEVSSEVTKTAEQQEMEKIAYVANVVEQSQTLVLAGEELFKLAEELENDEFKALAVDTYQLGERMGACLTKTASDNSVALEEAMEIAEDLNKVASVIAEIADEAKDEEFNKLAEAVITISNEMTDEANEIFEAIEKEAGVKEKFKAVGEFAKRMFGKGKGAAEAAGAKVKETAEAAGKKTKEHASKVKAWAMAHPKTAIGAGAGTAAALAGAGYAAKKK